MPPRKPRSSSCNGGFLHHLHQHPTTFAFPFLSFKQIRAACSSGLFAQSFFFLEPDNASDLGFPASLSLAAPPPGHHGDRVQLFDFECWGSRAMAASFSMRESSSKGSALDSCVSFLHNRYDNGKVRRSEQNPTDYSHRCFKFEPERSVGAAKHHQQKGFVVSDTAILDSDDGGDSMHCHGLNQAYVTLNTSLSKYCHGGLRSNTAGDNRAASVFRRKQPRWANDRPYIESNRESKSGAAGGILGAATAIRTSKHLFAGAISAVVSRTLVAPLERIKLEYIVRGAKDDVTITVQKILRNEGVLGFWKGNLVNIIRTAPFKSVNFYAYDTFRKQIMLLSGKKEVSNLEKFAAGAAAGVTASIICFPMDTVRTRMVAPGGEVYGNILSCFKYMIEKEGPLSLYAGLLPALVSMAPSGAVFYGVYDILKCSYLSSPKRMKDSTSRKSQARHLKGTEGQTENGPIDQLQLGPMRTLLYGAIAGVCAETVTYPLEVIRRQLQLQSAVNRIGMIATVKGLVEKGGIGALYAGLLPSTFQVLPSAAISYLVYETMKAVLNVT